MTDQTELPDEIALLWGVRETPRRGRKPSLTATDIARAAIEVADAEGLAAVSMARVAARLGNSTMALYRHVRSKDELLLLMTDLAMGHPPELPEEGDWRTKLERWARAVLAVTSQHPWYAHVPVNRPPAGPANLAWFDSGLGALAGTPLAEAEKIGVVMGLMTLVRGELRMRAELQAGFRSNPDAFGSQYGRTLRKVVDPHRMPALARLLDSGVFDSDALYDEAQQEVDFGFTLSVFLDGVEGRMKGR